MRGLGARRHDCVAFRPRTGGAIADRKNVVVAGGLQRLPNDELIARVSFEAVEVLQKGGRLDAGRPDHEFGIDNAAVCELDAIWRDGGDPRGCVNLYTEPGEEFGRGGGDARRQSRQNSIGGFDDVQRNVAVRVDAVEPKGHELPRGLVQFSGELDSGGTGANNRDLKLTRPQRLILVLRPQASIDQA